MKKLLPIVLALSLALSLSACGGGEESYKPEDVRAMADAGAFSEELEELDGDTAFALYGLADRGLEREDLTDCAILRSAGATCEEGAVLVLSDRDKARDAAEALYTYNSRQIEANEDYRPGEIPKLKEVYIDVRGNTVLMGVACDLDAANDSVD